MPIVNGINLDEYDFGDSATSDSLSSSPKQTVNGINLSEYDFGEEKQKTIAPSPEETPEASFLRRVPDLGVSLLKGAVGIPEAVVGLLDIPTMGYAGKTAEDLGIRFKETQEILDSLYSPQQQAVNKEVADTKGFFPTIGKAFENPSFILQTVAESAPSMLGAGGIGRGLIKFFPKLAPVIAGAAGEGLVSGGQAAEQIRQGEESGLLSAGQAGIAGLSGMLTGILGIVGGKLAKRLGVVDIDTLIAGGSVRAAVDDATAVAKKNVLRKMIESAISEGAFEELPQSLQEQMAQNVATGRPATEGVAEAGALGMLAGGVMGTFGGAGGHVLSGMEILQKDKENQDRSQEIQTFVANKGYADLNNNDLLQAYAESDAVQKDLPDDAGLSGSMAVLKSELEKRGIWPEDKLSVDIETKLSELDEKLGGTVAESSDLVRKTEGGDLDAERQVQTETEGQVTLETLPLFQTGEDIENEIPKANTSEMIASSPSSFFGMPKVSTQEVKEEKAPSTLPLTELSEGGVTNPPSTTQKTSQEANAGNIVAKKGSEFGLKGLNKNRWTVDGNAMGNTPEEAVAEYNKQQAIAKDQADQKATYDFILPKLKSGDYTEADIKKITAYGKTTTSTKHMDGILMSLGLTHKQAGQVRKKAGDVDTTSGGAILYDVGKTVETARAMGLLGEKKKADVSSESETDLIRKQYGLPPQGTVHLYRAVTPKEYAEWKKTGIIKKGGSARATTDKKVADFYATKRGKGARVIEFDANVDDIIAGGNDPGAYRIMKDIKTLKPVTEKKSPPTIKKSLTVQKELTLESYVRKHKINFNIPGHTNKEAISDGLLSYTKNDAVGLDKRAEEMQGLGLLGATPDGYATAGDYLYAELQKIVYNRINKKTQSLTAEEDQAIKEFKEEALNEGYDESVIEGEVGEDQRTGKKEAYSVKDSEAHGEAQSFLEEDDEFVKEEETPSKELFDTSSMFTLSGSQPVEQKTMKVPEKKGERLLDVPKQTTDELKDRLSGEKAKREFEEGKKSDIVSEVSLKVGSGKTTKTNPAVKPEGGNWNKVYHATRETFDKFDFQVAENFSDQNFGALWFFKEKQYAKDYLEGINLTPEGRGDNPHVKEVYLKRDAKIFDVQTEEGESVFKELQKELDEEFEDEGVLPDIDWDRQPSGNPYIGDYAPEIIAKLKTRGYDGALFEEGNGRASIAVWNTDIIYNPNESRSPGEGEQSLKVGTVEKGSLLSPEESQALVADILSILADGSTINFVGKIDPNRPDIQKALTQWKQGNPGASFVIEGMHRKVIVDGNTMASIIEVSMGSSDIRQTAWHEAWHSIDEIFLTANEKKILAEKLTPDIERQADIFAKYAANQKHLLPKSAKPIFERIREFFEKIGNYLKGRGFTNAEDVFNRALRGELKERTKRWKGEGQTAFQISVKHGSPFVFDRFTTDKIGSGEGAQMFGWGLYFTDKEDVAKYYAEKTTNGKRNLYNVTLHKGKDPSEYHYMDWEKSIGKELATVIENAVGKEYLEKKYFTYNDNIKDFNGATAYNFLEDYLAEGNELPGVTVEDYNYPKAVSLFLLRNGIDGIKYPAGTLSGGKTDGFNYVVFDENAVTIEDRVSFKITPVIKNLIDRNAKKAADPEKFPLPIDKEFRRLYDEAMGKDYSKAKAYTLTPSYKAYGPNARPEWTANYENFKGAREERQTLNSEFMRKIDNFLNAKADKVVNVEKVFFEGDATLGQKIRDLNHEARQVRLGGNLELSKQLRERAKAIKVLNRYSDEELANGIVIERTGEVVKLNPEEIAMYKELRDGYDYFLRYLLENMAKVAFDGYSKAPWFTSMVDLFNDVTLRQTPEQRKTLRTLNKLALNKIRGKKAETIQKNRAALMDIVKEHIATVSGITDQAELSTMTKEMVGAYKKERVSINAVKKARNRIGQITAYAPRVREQAKAYFNIYKTVKSMSKDGQEKITKELVANYPIEEKAIYKIKPELRGQAINQMWEEYKSRHKNEDLSYKVDRVTRESDTSYRGVNDMNLQRIIDNAITSIKGTKNFVDGPVLDNLKNSLVQAVANEMKVRGFGRSLVSRKLQHIEGYKTTGLQKITVDYITGLTGMITKQKSALRAYDILKTVPKKDTVLYEDMAKYTQDMLRNQNGMDRASGKAKGLLFTWYLSGLLKMVPIQLTQNYATGMPEQAQKMREWGIKGFAEARYHKAMADATTIRVDKKTGQVKQNKRINELEARLLTESLHNGNTADQYVRYITGLLDTQMSRKATWLLEKLSKPFSMMETFNRESAALSMFRMAWEHYSKTIPDLEERYQAAKHEASVFVSGTHFDFGKENLPRLATGGDAMSIGVKTLMTFRSFNHNYVQFIFGSKDWKTIAHSLAYVALFGGMMGLPFIKDILDLLEKLTGKSYTKAAREVMRKYGGKTLETFGIQGLPALAGANISGSLAMGIPFADWMTGGSASSTVFGVVGGMGEKIAKGINYGLKGELYRAGESLAPEMLASPMKAMRTSEIGKEYLGTTGYDTTSKGKPKFDENGKPLSMDTGDVIAKMMGFNPSGYSMKNEAQRSASNIEEYFSDWHTKIYETYRAGRTNHDPKTIAKALRQIREFNQAIVDKEVVGLIPRIKMSNVVKAAKMEMTKKQKREAQYKRNYLAS